MIARRNRKSKPDEVFSCFRGKYLAVDTNPVVLKGEWNHGHMVLIEFPDQAALKSGIHRWNTGV